jgi:hypothetical protein
LGWAFRVAKSTATATTNADPPFDFAQGRLFGDDNKKGKYKCEAKGRQNL